MPESIEIQIGKALPSDERETFLTSLRVLGTVRNVDSRSAAEWMKFVLDGIQMAVGGAQLAKVIIDWRRAAKKRGVDPQIQIASGAASLDLRSASDDEVRRWLSS